MGDIFNSLNHTNKPMQGGGVNIIEAEENLKAFQKKLPIWKLWVENNNFVNFLLLHDRLNNIYYMSAIWIIAVPGELKQAIAMHFDELTKSFDGYFPTKKWYPVWLRYPFTFSIATADVNDEYLDEIIEVQQQLF